MVLHGGLPEEALVTLRALEGPLPRVHGLVSDQAALHKVALLAVTALETLLLTLDHPGPPEFRVPSRFVLVLWTLRGLPLGMVPLVLYQVSLYVEDFPTHKAGTKSQPWWNFLVTWGTHWLKPRIVPVLTRC